MSPFLREGSGSGRGGPHQATAHPLLHREQNHKSKPPMLEPELDGTCHPWSRGSPGGEGDLTSSLQGIFFKVFWPPHVARGTDQGLNPCPLHWEHGVNHWTTREVLGSF